MTFTGLNFASILVAFGFSFVSGAIWFGPKTFYPVWMRAKGNVSGGLNRELKNPVLLFGGTILGVLIQTLTLGVIINSLQLHNSHFGALNGAGVGFVAGVGISMCSSISHRLFGGENLKVWIIETANDAINLTIAGAIIATLN